MIEPPASPQPACPEAAFYRATTRARIGWQLAGFVTLFAVCAGPATGVAQGGEAPLEGSDTGRTGPAPPEQDQQAAATVRARAHFQRGLELYAARRYRQALRELELAASGVPSAELWYDIARCHEELGEDGLAVEYYRRYLRDRVEAADRAEIERRIHSLQERQAALRVQRSGAPRGLVRVDASVDGALLAVGGEPVGYTPVERLLELPPGRHTIALSHPDHAAFRGTIVVEEGSLTVARADLRRLPTRTPAAGTRVWTWVLGVAATAGLAAGAAAGVASGDARHAGESARANDLRAASDLGLAAGLGLAVAATIAYFSEGGEERLRAPPAN